MTNWYVRPYKGDTGLIHGTGDGKSYTNAFCGVSGGGFYCGGFGKITGVDTGTETITTNNATDYFPNNSTVMFTTDGALPSPLQTGTVYWIRTRTDANHLKFSAEKFGSTINLSDSGSGNMYVWTANGIRWGGDGVQAGDTVYCNWQSIKFCEL
jgi:hypothetical protein